MRRFGYQKIRFGALAGAIGLGMLAGDGAFDAAVAGEKGHHHHKHDHGHHDEAPHVHGIIRMNLAAEGGRVEIELLAPGADTVGFEHLAKSAEDKAAVKDARAKFENGAGLFRFPGAAGCKLAKAHVDSETFGVGDDDHDHGHGHGHGKHDHGKHDHAKHDHGEHDGHAEFRAKYRFQCANPPDRLDLTLFQVFPRSKTVEVRTLTASGQGKATLTAAAPGLKL